MPFTQRIGFYVILHDDEFAVVYAGSQVVFQGTPEAARTYCQTER